MFGRRTNDSAGPRRALPATDAAVPAKAAESRPAPIELARAPVKQEAPPQERRHSEEYYDVKTTVFNALIDTIDLTQLAKLEGVGGLTYAQVPFVDVGFMESIVGLMQTQSRRAT